MQTLVNMYRPITGTPFQNNESYREIAPCEALKPYIRCFWGTDGTVKAQSGSASSGIVIPDTCMDIIFYTDYTENNCSGIFCTIDEHSYFTENTLSQNLTSTFAVRFYGWSVILFAEEDFTVRGNGRFPCEYFFGRLKSKLEPLLHEAFSLKEKIKITEKFLLEALNKNRINTDLLNSIYYMLKTHGRAKISDICGYSCVSEKKLERVFNFNTGVSPKAFSSLLRYQLLWQDMVFSKDFDMLDAVEKYGYFDQAHLLRDFKRRHLMTPREALAFADKCR